MVGDDEIARLGKTFDQMADAVEANRDMERRLVTDVAHELRTPLMAIQSTVEAMIDGVFEADEERLETLNSEVRRLSRLVDALLKLSRLENRANSVEFAKVDLVEMVDTVVSAHQAYVEEAGLTFTYHHDSHVYVYGNADMLRQATANLISNAVRYTPEGGSIKVSVTQGDLMGKIMVQDTGIGFTPEEAKNVFARFWRADAGRTRESGGLGIGLSVVKEIADRHNGWVRAEGRPNEGARFTIYIPIYNSTTLRKGKSKRLGMNN
jgi:signal transduction histidine kinase